MTLSELIENSRKKARVHSASAPDADVVAYLNEGIRVFSQGIRGLPTKYTWTPSAAQEALPDDFLDMIACFYGPKQLPLLRSNWQDIVNDDSTGKPLRYAIFNTDILFRPIPASFEEVTLYYSAYFTTFPDTFTGTETVNVPEEYQMALVYFAAQQLATDRFEYEVADRNYALFRERMNQFHAEVANETTQIGFQEPVYMPGGFYPFKGAVL